MMSPLIQVALALTITVGGAATAATVDSVVHTKVSAEAVGYSGKTTICHKTGSVKNPYQEITVDNNALAAHSKHQGDIIPAPAGGCPTS